MHYKIYIDIYRSKCSFLTNKLTDCQYLQTVFQNSKEAFKEVETADEIEEDFRFVTTYYFIHRLYKRDDKV